MKSTLQHLFKAKFAHMTFLGFSAGIPYYLIFSSLSLWLDQVGIERAAITLFSWAFLGYSFKFLWSPLVDRLPLPWLSAYLGQRRSWLLVAQSLVIVALILMALTDPAAGSGALTRMALAAVLLGFSAATQDILIDAWRIEASDEKDIAMLSSLYIVGYRIGMITSGAGALYLADFFGTSSEQYLYEAWRNSYLIMALTMLVGVVTTWVIKEPKHRKDWQFEVKDYLGVLWVFVFAVTAFILSYAGFSEVKADIKTGFDNWFHNTALSSVLAAFIQLLFSFVMAYLVGGFVARTPWVNRDMARFVYVAPVVDLFKQHRKHMWLLIGIICTYRISDLVMGVSANLFYQGLGYDLSEIATASKNIGLIMTLLGGVLGGYLAMQWGIVRVMIIGASLSALTNLLFMMMAGMEKDFELLIYMIAADNLSAGLAMAAFVAFLSLLVNKQFTAVQYAMFSSVMTLFPKILGGYSGAMVDAVGFAQFFFMTFLMGLPVVVMLIYAEGINLIKKPKKAVDNVETPEQS
ncbi:AmpG family muropeptide MFS transporter [Marinicella rhabdoformis]|uniref:AmpG family muropeptide MFS transporter n=1 Tax=Marinicella rhabdoformis TaxID=2580566 RepID=UPI001C5516F2|nr:MFS transporter [Marinicella rhabdoformis]